MTLEGSMRHLAFFEALGTTDESDPSWRSLSAGLVVMRLVDEWVEEGPDAVAAGSWGVKSVRDAIAQISNNTPLRRVLSAVVDAVVAASPNDTHTLNPRLMAYGQALEYEARWQLAVDVYKTIVAQADPVDDADIVVSACIQMAFASRMMEDLETAARAYARASEVATTAGDSMGALRGRLGDAKIAMARGNMPAAESILEATIAAAQTHGFRDLESRALGDRAYIAGVTRQYDRAIRFAYAALEITTDERDRDRFLNNIATGFRLLGLFDTARDAYVILAATSQEQYVRWLAELNLMELAAQQRLELQFDKYRRRLDVADFSPFLRVTYLLHVGRGYHCLDRAETGIPYLEEAIDTASKHKMNQLMFEAEEALLQARRRQSTSIPTASVSVELAIRDIIDGVQRMKLMAGV